jgi:hypothetical protein
LLVVITKLIRFQGHIRLSSFTRCTHSVRLRTNLAGYILTAQPSLGASNTAQRSPTRSILMCLITILYIFTFINLVLDWNTPDRAFVKHGATSDSIVDFLDTAPIFENLVPEIFKVLSIFIADGILASILKLRKNCLTFRVDLEMLDHLELLMESHHAPFADDCGEPW